jgi:hypothetical protein
MKKKTVKEERFQNIEESIERISCSVARISGTLDAFYEELLLEKKAERLRSQMKSHPEVQGPSFFHEEE